MPSVATAPSSPQLAQHGFWRRLASAPSALAGAAIVLLLVAMAAAGPSLTRHDPSRIELRAGFLAPGADGHLLGTDHQGRDVLARLLAGARLSLAIGVGVSIASGAIGVTLGLLAGFYGGWIERLAMRGADIILAFPRLILAIGLLAVVRDPSLWIVFIVLSVTGWAGVARLVRGAVLQTREAEYVLAAHVAGAGDLRLMVRHILPNILGVVAVWITLAIPGAIMAEAGLSFLGLGAEPGTPSWGMMISDARDYFRSFWWIPMFPGLALAFSVLGWNLLGDAIQEALNPRLHKR
jgi:ABC-type dipeptide/oligopeptide/nickel transport system permease subunit